LLPIANCYTFHREVKTQPKVDWIDNFAKIFAVGLPNQKKGLLRDCAWTGAAMKKYTGEKPVSMELMYTDDHKVIPAMPDDIWECQPDLMAMIKDIEKESMNYLAISLVTKYDVRTVPLCVELNKHVFPEEHLIAQMKRDGVRDFYPDRIIKENSASNIGLLRMIRERYDSMGMADASSNSYTVLNTDIAIFSRCIKVKMRIIVLVCTLGSFVRPLLFSHPKHLMCCAHCFIRCLHRNCMYVVLCLSSCATTRATVASYIGVMKLMSWDYGIRTSKDA
jgi:hypothetical protein